MNGRVLFELMIAHAWQVTLLACLVLVLTNFLAKDRPHLAHALWALVLLKCISPPIIASPTSIYSWTSHAYAVASQAMPWPATDSPPPVAEHTVEGIAPLVIRVSPSDIDAGRTDDATSTVAAVSDAKVGRGNWFLVAIGVWCVISCLVFAMNSLRLWIFLKRVKQASLPTSANLSQLVESLAKRLKLRRKVRICTVDAAIGPAVIGFIRPTILIPKVMVEGRFHSQLEPIVAHELIHVRRGDLVWAMLQAISVALWWFHPLVWLAERLLTREAERSCDEETIAGLGCSPAVYARSLLDVMERKHQLRVAPSLPGVRPVDITAKRLERIMRLGHGCYRQRPWWVVAVWLIGCALVLPGGAWLTAQENPEQKPSVFKEASFSSENRQQSAKQPDKQPDKQPIAPAERREVFSNPVAKLPVAQDQAASEESGEMAFQFEHVLELADLLERLHRERSLAKADLEKELIRLLKAHTALELEGKTEDADQALKLALEDPAARAMKSTRQTTGDTSLRVVNNQLYIRATAEKRKAIEQCLAHFKQFGFMSIVTEISSYEFPRKLTEKDLAAISEKFASEKPATKPEPAEVKGQAEVTSDLGLKGTLTLNSQPSPIVLVDADIEKFTKWFAEDNNRDVKHIACPKVVSLSGQLATVEMGATRDFTLSHNLFRTEDPEPTVFPVTQRVMVGSRYEIRATLAEGKKDDAQHIKLNVKFHLTEVERVDKSKQTLEGIEGELDVERPIVRGLSLELSPELGVNDALVIVQTSKNKTCVTLIHCSPLAHRFWNVPRANLGEIAPTAYVTVSDELQSDLEVTLLKQKLMQLGIGDYRIAEGRIQVNFAEDWKAATNAFQELRSSRNSTNGSTNESPQKDSDNTFTDGETSYEPIQVFGPFTRAQAVPLLGQVPYVNRLFKVSVKLDVPSDDEILQALEKDASNKGLALKDVANGQLKMTATKIKEFSDAARFVPLVGDAILHHSHYKCEFHDAATQELKHTAYVDYCQFQVAIGSAK